MREVFFFHQHIRYYMQKHYFCFLHTTAIFWSGDLIPFTQSYRVLVLNSSRSRSEPVSGECEARKLSITCFIRSVCVSMFVAVDAVSV